MNVKEKFINFMAQLSEGKEEVKPVDTATADEATVDNHPDEGEVEKDVEISQRVSDLEVAVAGIKAALDNFIAKQEAEEGDQSKDENSEDENSEDEKTEEDEKKSEEEQTKEDEAEEKVDEEKEELKRKCEQLSAQLSAMESEIKALKALPSAKQDTKRSRWF